MTDFSNFRGIFTALVTPFADGKVDEKAFRDLVAWQVEEGVHGLVPCGTTGESPTLSHAEHMRVIEICVEVAGGQVPVMAGTGSNSTEEAVMLTKHAAEAGADAALVVAPYYNKPTQEGLYQHFKAVAESVDIPIFVYNIPGRSVVNITDDTFERLAKISNIAGIKDATGNLERPLAIRHRLGSGLVQLSGEDMTAVAFNASGGLGCISVVSNIVPGICASVQSATLRGEYAKALSQHEKLVPLINALFAETNPVPVKYALALMGKCKPDVRLPLVEVSPELAKRMKAALAELNLI